jgi:hypothetical protein
MRTPAVTTGILRSEHHEASCTVRATKVSLPGAPNAFQYVDFSIENVSKELPEGIYQIFAFGETHSVRYENGHWLSAS